jgi:hypothetical protein
MNDKQIQWCCIPVTVDDTVADLIYMTPPNQDAKQEPEFRVTKATVDLVPLDFDLYKPSLERMAVDWREQKEREMKKVNSPA